ncbi:MAG TPA: LysM peptidoglycan-binding domain-containing protein [Anaerolineaceae bacterium]
MKSLKEVSIGMLSGIATSLVILGAILVAMTEGQVQIVPPVLSTITLPVFEDTPVPGLSTFTPPPPQPSARPVMVTPTQNFTHCPIPVGWELYTILPGDRLSDLAASRGVNVALLSEGNCLVGTTLIEGSQLALPSLPTATFTPSNSPTSSLTFTLAPTGVRCGPKPGWVAYRVQSGDNLFRLSQAVHLSVQELMVANCLSNAVIITGQTLFLPFLPPRPTLTFTLSATLSPPPTRIISFTPTRTLIITRTLTLTTTATGTFVPTTTVSATVTDTVTDTVTATVSAIVTATVSATVTDTTTAMRTTVPTPVETVTPVVTETVVGTSTATSTSTETPEGTSTPSIAP